jgi:hypothetical protein
VLEPTWLVPKMPVTLAATDAAVVASTTPTATPAMVTPRSFLVLRDPLREGNTAAPF